MTAALPAVYGITAAALLPSVASFLALLERRLQRGDLKMVQVRDKQLEAKERKDFAHACVRLCHEHDCRVLVNDDPQLARQAGADGVHLSSKALAGPAVDNAGMVGASCHSLEELDVSASRHRADFAVLSPVQATLTHVDAEPLGWEAFARLAGGNELPVYALGGLALADLAVAREHGAAGIASMRDVWGLPAQKEQAA